jgi:hypothetical protein
LYWLASGTLDVIVAGGNESCPLTLWFTEINTIDKKMKNNRLLIDILQ